MPASQALIGIGTLFQRGNGATPEVFTTIAEIRSFGGPNRSREFVDITHLTSPDEYREVLPTFKDGGQVTLNMNFIPGDASQDDLNDDFENARKVNFKIIWPNGQIWAFAAYVTGPPNPDVSFDKQLEGSVTIKVTGPVTRS